MLDFIRDLGKSAGEKRQERLNAYVDEALTPPQRQQFEQELAQDAELQAEVNRLQQLKQNLRRLPRRSAPRNFTLDPAVYGAPEPQPLVQLYPAMRVATALTAVFFVIAVVADLLTFGAADMAAPAAEPVAMEAPATQVTAAAVTEAEEMEAAQVEEAADAEIAVEEAAEEEVAEEEFTTESVPLTAEATVDPLAPGGETMDTTGEVAQDENGAEAAVPAPTLTAIFTPELQLEAATEVAPAATEIGAAPAPRAEDEREETAVVPPPPPTPVSALRFFQIGLGVLLVSLALILVYTRRQM